MSIGAYNLHEIAKIFFYELREIVNFDFKVLFTNQNQRVGTKYKSST